MLYFPDRTTIEGQTTWTELTWLYAMASQMESVIEIGSYKGRSARTLCEACKGQVTCIDTWEDGRIPDKDNVYEEFLVNMVGCKNLYIRRGPSLGWAEKCEPADMVFVDAGHRYEDIRSDLVAWLPKATKLICGHDFF